MIAPRERCRVYSKGPVKSQGRAAVMVSLAWGRQGNIGRMGYTHYWHRPERIPDEVFRKIAADFGRLILPLSDFGVELAGGLGKGPPAIAQNMIRFNGIQECGHPAFEDLVIPYPTDEAEGIGPAATAIASEYSFGVLVKHRSCHGQCSYETFTLGRDMILRPGQEPDDMGLYVGFTKTGFRPYDIAVPDGRRSRRACRTPRVRPESRTQFRQGPGSRPEPRKAPGGRRSLVLDSQHEL